MDFSSSFTAINTPPQTQILASGPATLPPPPTLSSARQRNPVVANYLGLENGPESRVSSLPPSAITQPTQQIQPHVRLASSETSRPITPPCHTASKGNVYPDVSSITVDCLPCSDLQKPQDAVPDTDDLLYDDVDDEDFLALQTISRPSDDPLDDGIDDEELLTLTEETNGSSDFITDTQRDVSNPATHGSSASFKSPATIQAKLSAQRLDMKPIVRSTFPSQVRDRSPIIGLTPNCLLRTCFRIGEAINVGRNAARNGNFVFIELYARVLQSERTEERQTFTFCDLFHSKKPYLEAAYDAAIWKSVDLHEVDSRVFLSEGVKMCRCILATKSNGKEWIPTILNIWAAKEDDIMWAEGIVNY